MPFGPRTLGMTPKSLLWFFQVASTHTFPLGWMVAGSSALLFPLTTSSTERAWAGLARHTAWQGHPSALVYSALWPLRQTEPPPSAVGAAWEGTRGDGHPTRMWVQKPFLGTPGCFVEWVGSQMTI